MSTNTDPKDPKSSAPKTPSTLKEAIALLSEHESAITAASEKISSLESAHAEALAAATGERDALRTRYDEAILAASKHETELAAVRKDLEAEQSARAAAEDQARKSSENSARLEKLCGVHGIDSARAIASGDGEPAGQEGTREALITRYNALKTPGERASFYAKHKAGLLD